MARLILALAICGAALASASATAQAGNADAVPMLPIAPPAPYDSATGSVEPPAQKAPVPVERPVAEGKGAENPPAETAPQNGAVTESKPPENAEGRYTFSRMNEGYVRLDNRTGQVSICNKRTVGWTCQLAPEDRGVLENEIARLQEDNASLKKELLAHGLPLPGSMKGEPPVAHNERTFSLPSDPNIDRMKVIVEKAWRRLVDMITTLQKDVLKKS
jgi:hypothetical protein